MDAHDRSSARNAARTELFYLRRSERHAVAGERVLERRLRVFERHLEEVEDLLDDEFRRAHWGREPPCRLARRTALVSPPGP